MGKRILKVVAFCMLLFGVVAGISRLVERKESRQKMQPFLDRAGEYDVLFLGDSIMNTGVFPMEMWEKYGIKRIVITPPESSWKNRTTKEAKAGKTKLLIEEELTPWATFFQNEMKKGRPALDESVEGILNGRTFFAYDAVNNGLIDGIRPMDEIVKYAFEFAERQKIENL